RLNPLGGAGCGNVDNAATLPQSHSRTNQKKRTFDVLPKPDNLIRYRHLLGAPRAATAPSIALES
ncbi:MAG TPA: hypothetical protein VGG79_20970, partial [Roseiarcus sp.]